MNISIAAMAKIAGVGVAGLAAAMISTPGAVADPQVPVPPPGPDAVQAPAPAGPDAVQASAPAGPDTGQVSAPPDGIPHLPSPDSLPYDTSAEPVDPSTPGQTYARDIWHSMQTQDISWRQGLLLLIAQRPMNPNASPPPGMPAGPQEAGPATDPAAAPAPPPGYTPLPTSQ